jgi:prepilin-type processing-associated H-X9-DG protein
MLPAVSRARELAGSLGCKNNFKQIGLALGMYLNDNDDCFPSSWGSLAPPDWHTVNGALCPAYIPSRQSGSFNYLNMVFFCPVKFRSSSNQWENQSMNHYLLLLKLRKVSHPGLTALLGEPHSQVGDANAPEHITDIRHGLGSNILWVDSHVTGVKYGGVSAAENLSDGGTLPWFPY